VGAAEDRLHTILVRGKILVGTGSTNPPWHFKDADGNLIGYDVDMGHLLAKAIFDDPSKVEYVVQSSDSRIPNVLTDKVDITCQFMTVTAGRAQQVDFTIPIIAKAWAPPHEERQVQDLMTQEGGFGATVSVLQNVYAEKPVHVPVDAVDQYDSVDLIYQALNSAADAAATDMSSAKWFVRRT
jgi:polar amino acid transport system substrate-binding protein